MTAELSGLWPAGTVFTDPTGAEADLCGLGSGDHLQTISLSPVFLVIRNGSV